MNILCVDDEPGILTMLAQYLTKIRGHTVKTANNGEEGWIEFNSFQPGFDLVITDVRMPEMGGLQLLEKIRDLGSVTPVVIIAGHRDTEMDEATRKFGILKILPKPFSLENIDEILALVPF